MASVSEIKERVKKYGVSSTESVTPEYNPYSPGIKKNDEEEKEEKEETTQHSSAYEKIKEKVKSGGLSYDNIVTQDYINSFISDANSFLESAEKDYGNTKWDNASSVYETKSSTWHDLNERAGYIDKWLSQKKEYLGEETYEDLWATLSKVTNVGSSWVDLFKEKNDIYSKFESEEDYNKAVEEQKAYEDMMNFNLETGAEEIRLLQSDLDAYNTVEKRIRELEAKNQTLKYSADMGNSYARTQLSSNNMEISRLKQSLADADKKYGSKQGLSDLLSSKNQYYTLAERTQKATKLASAVNNPDFEEYASLGAAIKNPDSLDDVPGWFAVGEWNPFGQDVQNKVTWARDMQDEMLKKSTQGAMNGGTHPAVYQYNDLYLEMEDDEVSIYNYYLAKDKENGTHQADEYLESLEETLAYRKAKKQYGETYKDDLFAKLAFGVAAGLEQFGSGIANLFSDKDYIPSSSTQQLSGLIREDLEDDGAKLPDWMGGSSLGQVGYDMITTTSNMLPSILVSYIPVVGQVAGAGLLGASAAGNAKAEMLNLGYSKEQATAYGLMVGASEGILQYALGGIGKLGGKVTGNVIANAISKVDNAIARTAIKLGGNMLSEGLEEAVQTVLEPVFKSIATGEDFEGVDIGEVVYSGLLGALSALALEGGGTVVSEVNTYKAGQAVQKVDGGISKLTELGKTFSMDSVAYELAGRVTEESGAYTIGRLFQEVGATMSEQNMADIVAGLEAKGVDSKSAKKLAKQYQRFLNGEMNLTNEQIAVLEKTAPLSDVLRNNIIGQNTTVYQRMRGYTDLQALAEEVTNAKTRKASTKETTKKPAKGVSPSAEENASTGKNTPPTDKDVPKTNVVGIDSIENGVLKLRLDNGEVVDSKDYDFSSEDEALVYEAVANMDIDTANDLVQGFNLAKNAPLAKPQSVSSYMVGFNEARSYGKLGIPYEALTREGKYSKDLFDAQRKIAYNRGKIEAVSAAKSAQEAVNEAVKKAKSTQSTDSTKAKGGRVSFEEGVKATTKDEKRAVRLANYLSRAIGIDIVFYDARTTSDPNGKGSNGYFDETTNSIHLDIQKAHSDTKTIAFTLSHEVVHFIKKWSPEKFDTLARFLMEQYGEHGVDTTTMLSNKMAELNTEDKDLAYEEMICDAFETMLLDSNAVVKLMQLRQTDLSLFEKLKMHILELLNSLREAYRSLGYETTTDEAKALLKMTDVIDKFHSMFEEAAVDAAQSYGAVKSLNSESASVSEDGTIRLQMKQYQQTGRATLLNYLREQYGNEEANDLISTIDNIYDVMKDIKSDEALSVFSNWQDTEVELDENGHPIFTTSINNGDYELNQDFSRVCKKRRQLDFVLNMLAEDPAFEASYLTKEDFVKINKAIKAHGFEIACALCFVDSKRFRQAEWADSFANTWNDILNSIVKDSNKLTPFNFATKNPNLTDDGIEIDTSKAVTYRKWSDGKEDVKNRRTYESFDQMLSKADDGKWIEGNTNVRTIATLIRDNPELRHTFRGADIIASKGFDTIQRLAPGIRSILDGWGGSSVPKPSSNDASYDSSIINISGYNKKTAYAMGGVRMNSFSDFMAHMFFDYCQAFADLSAKELPSQAYTKELIYVRLFGRSGQKINMSGIAAIRDNALPTTAQKGVTKAEAEANEKIEKMIAGLDVTRLLEHLNKDIHQLTEADIEQFLDMCDYVWADESINMKHATLLQTGILYDKLSESKVEECYELLKAGEIEQALKVAGKENVDTEYAKNCGTIVVGVSDAHIRKLLRDPTVRMVIPYHKSGLNPIIARELRISAYNDYTLTQTTGVKRKGAKTTEKIGSTAIKDAYGLKDFAFYDWFGKTIDGKLYDGKATADKYLEWCEKGYYDEKVGDYVYYTSKGDGYILAKDFHKKATIVPKFDAFVGEENYYKVLEDFDCYDTITGEHSAQVAVDFFHNGLPSDYKDVLVGALKEEQKVHDDFRDHLDNKGLKEEVMEIVKARGYEPSVKKQAKPSKKNPKNLDPRTITEEDVVEMLENATYGVYDDGTYIPLRRNTPEFFIGVVKEHSKGTYFIEDYPIAATVEHLRQNMEEVDGQSYGGKRPHELSVDDIITISRKMGDPSYIVLQKNKRYAEVVSFYNKRNKQIVVSIDAANSNPKTPKNYKYSNQINGYDDGYYNIIVTQYEPDDFRDYMSKCEVVYDKKEMNGKYQVGSGRVVTVTHDTPFIEDIIAEEKPVVKKQLKKSSDSDYLDAVNRGDLNTAQKMLDKAASEAGYIKLFYHGTPNGDFTKFNTHGKPIWITASKEYAEKYSKDENPKSYKEDKRVMPLYAKMENRLDITSVSTIQYAFDDYNHRTPSSELKRLADVVGVDVSVLAKIGRRNNSTYLYHVINTADFANTIREKGYDSIKQSEYGNITFGVLDSSQLKSAYVATYNKKKVIPLSERFNPGNNDIRYQKKQLSNRTLLANALEDVAQNDIEKNKLAQYKSKIALIEAEQAKLAEIRKQANELRFTKGRTAEETKRLKDLDFEANQTANRINTYDKQLLNLESTTALKGVLEREKEMARKRAEEKGREKLRTMREREAEKTRTLLAKASESRKKGVESRHKTAMRHKIKDVVNELNQYLLKGTKDKHVPIELQKAVAEALNAVNMDTVGAEERIAKKQAEMRVAKSLEEMQKLSKEIEHIQEMGGNMEAKLSRLKTAYDSIINSKDPLVANSHDEVVSNTIEKVIEFVGDTPLRDMSLYQLEAVYDMYKMVLTTVRNTNKAFKAKKSEEISVIANRVMEEIDKLGKKKFYQTKAAQDVSKFDWNNLKPVYAFERIGSDTFTEVFNAVRAGEDTWAVDITEAQNFSNEQHSKYNYDSWDFKKRFSFTSTSGMQFELSLDQIMSLYAYSKREQARDHLNKGGIVFDETTEVTVKTKLGIPVKFNPTQATAYNLSDETIGNIISKLTPEQREFVDVMQAYLSDTMGEKGNEVSLALYGVKLYKEKNYFPLKSATQFMAKAKEQQKGEVKIKNSGFSKETTPKASNPIVLTPFMDVWAGHVNEMSMYHAFVLPLEDFYRVFNYKTPTSDTMATESVEMYLQNAYGKAATGYIDQLLKDLNGGARVDPTAGVINKLTGLFKKSAVFASLSVVVQQPSAIARALALVDARYFVGGKVSKGKHKDTWAEVKKYAPVAIIKEMGYFDTGMGQSTVEWLKGEKTWKDKVDDFASKAPALADEYAWCTIWNAVKRETLHTHKDLKPNSDEFLNAVGERFTEVITKTQVYDSVLARSANMRSKDTGMKMATAFMGEPTTSLNMLENAITQFKRGDKRGAGKAVGSVVASMILNSILVSFVYAGRDDDEEKSYEEKYIGTLTEELIDSFNPLTLVPFIKDIISIVQGYDVERSDMAVITDIIKAWNNLSNDNRSPYRKVEDFAGAIAAIFGLPVKNVMRDVRGIYNTVNSFINGEKTTGAGIDVALKEAITGKEITNGQQLYEAILNEDTAQIERVKGRFKDQTAIDSAIRKALRENDSRIKEAAEARYNGDIAEYMRIAKQIIAEGNFSQDNIVAAINAEINAIKKAEGETDSSDTDSNKVTSIYKMEDYYKALVGRDEATAYAVKEDIIKTAVANGKDRDDAESNFYSNFASHIRELYENGDISKDKAEDMLVRYGDKTEEEAASKVQYWEFKQKYPDYDDLSEDAVAKYYSDVEPYGISVAIYYDYSKSRAKCKGTDLNGDGKTDSGSVKSEVMAVIDSLPITSKQKDALYYLNGWAASTLWEAPWH